MSDHSSFVALATAKIAEHGRDAELITSENVGVSEWNPTALESRIPIKLIQSSFRLSEFNNSLIAVGDKRFLIDSSYPIDSTMRIEDSGSVYSIVALEELRVGDQVILYKVVVRI